MFPGWSVVCGYVNSSVLGRVTCHHTTVYRYMSGNHLIITVTFLLPPTIHQQLTPIFSMGLSRSVSCLQLLVAMDMQVPFFFLISKC